MVDRSVGPTEIEARVECTRCGSRIEICAFCESPACCPAVICYRCLRQELRQSLAQPRAHGG